MQVVKDHFGTEVFIGDALVHVVKHSTDVGIHYSIVYGFIWRGSNTEVQMKVISVEKHWYKNEYHYYRTTLTSNNFVKVPLNSIPEEIKNGLMKRLHV